MKTDFLPLRCGEVSGAAEAFPAEKAQGEREPALRAQLLAAYDGAGSGRAAAVSGRLAAAGRRDAAADRLCPLRPGGGA